MVKAAVILSGCGHMDGAEIRESVLALLYLDQQGAEVSVFAPDKPQMHVIDYTTGKPTDETRNVLKEAARIARGKIKPLTALKAGDFDVLVIPGGYGVAKNLADFATKGADCTVDPDFKAAILAFLEQKKPVGAICIAPAVLAAALKGSDYSPTLTIGEDKGTAAAIEACGSHHKNCATSGFVYDDATHIASCSAYMRDDRIAEVAKGIEQVIAKVTEVAKRQKTARAA